MKFSKGSFSSIFARSALVLTMVLAYCFSVSLISYAGTTPETSTEQKTSPSSYLTNSNVPGATVGLRSDTDRSSAERPAAFTSFTGSPTSPFSATSIRGFDCGSAEMTGPRSGLSEISTISISASSPITLASRCGNSLSSDISKTVLHYSDANRARNLQTFGELRATDSKNSLTGKHSLSFRQLFSAPEIGLTSEQWLRPRSNLLALSRPSILERLRYANFSTESLSRSASPRERFKGSIGWTRASLPCRCTDRNSVRA